MRVIHEIEELSSELKVRRLAQSTDFELAADAGIEVELPGTSQNISSGVAEPCTIAEGWG